MAVSSETSARRAASSSPASGPSPPPDGGWRRFERALRAGRTVIGPFDRIDHARQRTHVAGQVPAGARPAAATHAGWARLSHRRPLRALLRARSGGTGGARDRRSTAPGRASSSAAPRAASTRPSSTSSELVRRPDSRPPRSLLASHSLRRPAETVARQLGIEGPVETVSSACCSGGLAIEQALRAVRSGEVDVALAGGADVLVPHHLLRIQRAARGRPSGRAGRFEPIVPGMSLGEGGAVLVLESLEHACARGGTTAGRAPGRGLVVRRQPHDRAARRGVGRGAGDRTGARGRRARARRSRPHQRARHRDAAQRRRRVRRARARVRGAQRAPSRSKRPRACSDTCWEPPARSKRSRR